MRASQRLPGSHETLEVAMRRLGITFDQHMPRLPLGGSAGRGVYVYPSGILGDTLADVAAVLSGPVAQNTPCALPVPSAIGTGECIRCGWQHAPRGPGAVERWGAR